MKIKNKHNKFQRDIFIDTLFKYAKNDKKILLLSNDQGAIALDNFREKKVFNTKRKNNFLPACGGNQ